jgi:hypothetical protein
MRGISVKETHGTIGHTQRSGWKTTLHAEDTPPRLPELIGERERKGQASRRTSVDARRWDLYWLLRTSVRERGPLGFHRSPLFRGQEDLSHRNCREIVLMDQRKQACMGSRLSGEACADRKRGLPQTSSGMTLRTGWMSSTSWTLAPVVPLQAAQR